MFENISNAIVIYKSYPDFSEKNFLQYEVLDPATCSLEPDKTQTHFFCSKEDDFER